MEKIAAERQRRLLELENSKEQAINAVIEFAKDLYTILQNLEREAIDEVEKVFLETRSILEQELDDIEYKIIRMNNSLGDQGALKETKEQHNENDIANSHQVPNDVDALMKSFQNVSDEKIVFNEDNYIRDTLAQIESLGAVLTTKARTYSYYITSTKDVNVRLSNDIDTCNVTDACLIGPCMVLLVDNRNKRLKRFHTDQMSVLDHCDLQTHPYCACLINKREAVVTLSNNILQFISLGAVMTLTRQMKLNHCCYGVAYKEDKLFITDSSCSVHIYDQLGNTLQTVSNDSSGNHLFAYTRQIIVSDWGNQLYITDWTNKLTILDTDGEHIDIFKDNTIEQANGVNTDGNGNVFICGYASRSIIQIGPDGKRKAIIAKSSENLIDHPYAMCFVPGQCLLFVTQGDNDKLKLFHLK